LSAQNAGPRMRKRRELPATRLLAVLAALLVLGACVAPTRSERLLSEEQTVDGLTIGLAMAASPRLNRPQQLSATLKDAQGSPVEGASVYFDLMMPAMPMGTNKPLADARGQGVYEAGNVVMDMTGEWEIAVVATVDGVERRAVFTRTVVE
jgi:hypothetical protein